MIKTRSTLLMLLSCQTALAGAAFAQDTIQLDTVVINSQADDGTGPAIGANPMTLTGAKTATPVTEVPQSVAVIPSETLRQGNISKLDGALAYTSGVIGQPYGYDSDTNWIMVRGFAATANGIFQDGLPNFSFGFGGFYVDPHMVERIEVLKGPSSVLYGSSNPGGIVNYVTKQPTGQNSTEVELGFDEHGRVWTSVDQNRVIDRSTAYRFLGKLERQDGHGAFEPGFHGLLSGSIRHETAAGAELSFGLDYLRIDEDHVGNAWLPYVGTVVDAPFGRIDRDFNTGEPGHDRYERDQVTARFGFSQEIGAWRIENNARIGWSNVEEDSVYAYGYDGFALEPSDPQGTLSRLVFDHESEAVTFLNDTRASTKVTWGGAEHSLLFGMDLKYFRLDQMQASAVAPGLTVVDPQYGAALPTAFPYIDQKLTQRQVGFYAQDQIRWGDGWIATLNARYDHVKTEAGVNRATGAAGMSRTDGRWSGRLGIARTLPNGVTPYASVSTYFLPKIATDISGATSSPETGRQIEAGVKWQANEDLLVTAAAFDIHRNNITQAVIGGITRQLGEVRSRGIELQAQGRLTDSVRIEAEVTKLDVEILDDLSPAVIGKTPYSTPETTAAVRVSWTPQQAAEWTLTGGVRWTGKSWADNENTLRVPDYTVLDLGATRQFEGGWEANLAVTNVTDKKYVSSCQTGFWCYYGEGRNISLSIRKSF